MSRCCVAIPKPVAAAMKKIMAFVEARESLTWLPVKLAAKDRKKILANKRLPPSYRAYVAEYGLWAIEHVNECIKLLEPEALAGAYRGDVDNPDADDAIAFQYIDDDAVDNYFCFNPHVDLGKGELAVVRFYHDEPFALARAKPRGAIGFDKHLVAVIDDFMETYEDEP